MTPTSGPGSSPVTNTASSFTAGLIGSLIRRRQHLPAQLAQCPAHQLSAALDDAILVASLNCQRRGNDPPALADLPTAPGTT
jgi:hypothetical protein